MRLGFAAILLVVGCQGPPGDPCVPAAGGPTLDSLGGDGRVALAATGAFRVEKLCERWWLVTPDGHPFYSVGVNSLGYGGNVGQTTGSDLYRDNLDSLYESEEAWADITSLRLRSWGFNTAASWSDNHLFADSMAFTVNLSLSGGDWVTGEVADFFDPGWEQQVIQLAAERTEAWVDSPHVIGYFIDNETRWGPDWRGNETLLQLYLSLDALTAGKSFAVDVLADHFGSIEAMNVYLGSSFSSLDDALAATDGWDELDAGTSDTEAALTTAFLELAANRYFRVTSDAVRAADPNHMILGNREVSVMTRREVWEAAASHVDVLSVNNYEFAYGIANAAMTLSGALDPADWFAALHELVDLPILITEFGYRANDSGLPNSWPPIYPTWDTQADRAEQFTHYARGAHETPWIVGYHWFRWVDQPEEGRFDGEDNNWGLVDERDEPYTVLTDRMSEINGEVWDQVRIPRR
jgi:hypothetical protein